MKQQCKIKFCGIRRLEDVTYMNEFMPDYVGFVFAPSRRQVSPAVAMALGQELHSDIKRVGVLYTKRMRHCLRKRYYHQSGYENSTQSRCRCRSDWRNTDEKQPYCRNHGSIEEASMKQQCKIKFCGIRRLEDVTYMNEFMPDYVGFVFAPSRRQVSPAVAMALGQELHSDIKRVGVFVNEPIDKLIQTAQTAQLDVLQLHGDEDCSYMDKLHETLKQETLSYEIWKAVRVKDEETIRMANQFQADKLLLDSFTTLTYGGSGKVANWEIIQTAKIEKPFFLAGGLTSQNIVEGIKTVQPYGVDLSGGIETDGCKDRNKIARIIELVRNC